MKVLFVAHSTRFSGANKSFFSIIEHLHNDVDITVLTNSTKGELIDKLKALNIPCIYYKYDWCYAHSRNVLYKQIGRYLIDVLKYRTHTRLRKDFLDDLKRHNFDLIYSNTSVIDIGAKISEKLGVPHVWHIREFGEEDFGFIPIVRIKYIQRKIKESAHVIVISKALKKKYQKFVSDYKLSVIYNGFDIEKEIDINYRHDFSKKINLLITGQVCEAKGQIYAIEAAYQLYNMGLPVKLYVAGTIDKSYIRSCIKKYPEHEKWLEMLGNVKDIYKLRENIDIELVCSRYEAFGRVTIEAMLHSIPVIGSNTGSTPELIQHRKTGMLYDYGNVDQLVGCILELIKDSNLYDNIIKNAQEYAKTFTIEKTANEVKKVFDKVYEQEW